jgi:hypothetical protein
MCRGNCRFHKGFPASGRAPNSPWRQALPAQVTIGRAEEMQIGGIVALAQQRFLAVRSQLLYGKFTDRLQ